MLFTVLNENLDIITIIKNLHQIVGSGIIDGAENYKKCENYLVNSNGEEINFTLTTLVAERMQELKKNMKVSGKL